MIDLKACLLVYAIACVLYAVTRWTLTRIDRWLAKKYEKAEEKMEPKPCPVCGGEPRLVRCGDKKEYLVYQCSKCHKTPVRYDEAMCTERGARKIWNYRVKEATK